jgi:16S rRNA (uracil1498-N3)-methyltransferase
VVRQATELGVDKILPIVSQRTLLKPSGQKIDRWQRIAQEAAEQCERPKIPQIYPTMSLDQSLGQLPAANHGYFCVARGDSPSLLSVVQQQISMPQQTQQQNLSSGLTFVIATGPEGGWTEEEVEWAIANGFQLVSLGPLILRAVTAPLAALSIVMSCVEH